MTELESNILIVLLVAGIIPIAWFIYRYMRYSPWWETAIGRTVLGQKFAMLALLSLSLLLRVLGPEYEYRALLNAAVLSLLIWFFWKTLIELLRVQKASPHRDALKAFIRRHSRRKE
ncbi:hypothetical protein NB037_03050 [Rathayibacter sp. ZW T2_19]|uniref:Uncharacterized protein n=1 Tax=Rathayibacter rubneri TaxID=2950106 RepID=A0A9X2DUH1_9MICO|nr:hypothetical protein [Rathayibacter rubneri]MCM6761385.1 hypothetical protein [Rathayibacter rubneri]